MKTLASLIVALLLAVVARQALAQGKVPVPPGGDPAMACGQTPDGRSYWTEYAFCDLAVRGPAKAKGLIFWSHGVDADRVQYDRPAPPVLRRLAEAGWDVVKINRNNLHEHCRTLSSGDLSTCWSAGGTKHVADLVERGTAARTQGYRRLIAAGQSFGGAISIEASNKAPGLFYGVLALSPGHGSDAASQGGGSKAAYYTLDKMLLDALSAQRGQRVVLSLPPLDAYSPNRDGDPIWPKARTALQATGEPFVLLGEGLPINGHGAALTAQFSSWFGSCIERFLAPDSAAAGGETTCPPPSPVPEFLVPANLKVPSPGTDGPARWLGAWSGPYTTISTKVLVVFEKLEGSTPQVLYATSTDAKREVTMASYRPRTIRLENDTITIGSGGTTIVLKLLGAGSRIDVRVATPTASWTAVLSRKEGPL